MDNGDLDRLTLKNGEAVTERSLRQLEAAIARATPLKGVRSRRRSLPWGTIHNQAGGRGGSSFDAPVFRPEVLITKDGAEVRWTGPRALIGGEAPTISEKEIFTIDDRTGKRPFLAVKLSDFGDGEELGVYFKVTVDQTEFRALTVVPVAKKITPPREPYVGYKLALFLRVRGKKISYVEEDDRQLFSAQGFFAANRRTGGIFEPLFWATF